MPESHAWLKKLLLWSGGVLAAIGTACQIAGVTSVILAYVVLVFGIWILTVAEVWFSEWIRKTGRYKPSILAVTCCISGCCTLLVAGMITNYRLRSVSSAPPTTLPNKPQEEKPATSRPVSIPAHKSEQPRRQEPQERADSPSTVIQMGASLGNLPDRAKTVSNQILSGVSQPWCLGPTQMRDEHTCSMFFRGRSLGEAVSLQGQFAQLNFRNERLDSALESIHRELGGTFEMTPGNYPINVLPVQIEEVGWGLKDLADAASAKQNGGAK